jgi:hypothetical protein
MRQKRQARNANLRNSNIDKGELEGPSDSAVKVLDDLSALLRTLGIRAKFRVSKIKATPKASSSKTSVQPYVFEIGEVLSCWHQEPPYLDKLGNPRPLSFDGKRPSFTSLVSKAAANFSPRKILFELQKVKAVSITNDGMICALQRSINAFGNREFAINHTFLALRGFIRTLQHNLDSSPSNAEQLFHRIAWNGAFDRKDTARLKIWIAEHGESFLESIDDWMKRHSVSRNRRGKNGKGAVNAAIGIYLAVDK